MHEMRDNPSKHAAARQPHLEGVIDRLNAAKAMFEKTGSGEETPHVGGASITAPTPTGFYAKIGPHPDIAPEDAPPVRERRFYSFYEVWTGNAVTATDGNSQVAAPGWAQAMPLESGRTGSLSAVELQGRYDVPEGELVWMTHGELAPPLTAESGEGGNAEGYRFRYDGPAFVRVEEFPAPGESYGPYEDCVECPFGAPDEWTLEAAGFSGDLAALNGSFSLAQDGPCDWVSGIATPNWILTAVAGTWTLVGDSGVEVANYEGEEPDDCCLEVTFAPVIAEGGGAAQGGDRPARLTAVPGCCARGSGVLLVKADVPCTWAEVADVLVDPLDLGGNLVEGLVHVAYLKTAAPGTPADECGDCTQGTPLAFTLSVDGATTDFEDLDGEWTLTPQFGAECVFATSHDEDAYPRWELDLTGPTLTGYASEDADATYTVTLVNCLLDTLAELSAQTGTGLPPETLTLVPAGLGGSALYLAAPHPGGGGGAGGDGGSGSGCEGCADVTIINQDITEYYYDSTINYYETEINYYDVDFTWTDVTITIGGPVTIIGDDPLFIYAPVFIGLGLAWCGWWWICPQNHVVTGANLDPGAEDPHMLARLVPNADGVVLPGITPVVGPDGTQALFLTNVHAADSLVLSGAAWFLPGADQLPLRMAPGDGCLAWDDGASNVWRLLSATHGDFRFFASSAATVTIWNDDREADFVPEGDEGDVLTQTADGPEWHPPVPPDPADLGLSGVAVVYRTDCVDGHNLRYYSVIQFVDGVLTQGVPVGEVFVPGSWAFESNQGCCSCTPIEGGCPCPTDTVFCLDWPAVTECADPEDEEPAAQVALTWASDCLWTGSSGDFVFGLDMDTGTLEATYGGAGNASAASFDLEDVTCELGGTAPIVGPGSGDCVYPASVAIYVVDDAGDCAGELPPPPPPPGCSCDEADEFEVVLAGVTCSGEGSPDDTYALVFEANCAWSAVSGDWVAAYLPDLGLLVFDVPGSSPAASATYAGPIGCGGTYAKVAEGTGCSGWPATLTVTGP
jgi:hypothetical protein